MKPHRLKRSRLACGVALMCVLFSPETVMAHPRFPSPPSPLIWSLLGGAGVLAALLAGWWRRWARWTP